MRSEEASGHWEESLGGSSKMWLQGKEWGHHPSYRAHHEQRSEEGNKAGQGGQEERSNGDLGLGMAYPSSPDPVIKSGEAKWVCQPTCPVSHLIGHELPRIKKRKKKKRKVLIMWLEILIPEIKFYELPIAQHPVFLTFSVSHTVF